MHMDRGFLLALLAAGALALPACGDDDGDDREEVDTECLDSPVPDTCEEAHGNTGCCADGVMYFWDFDSAIGLDCGEENDPSYTCGWTGGIYDCGGNGADPDNPGAMCCGASNPYSGC
jgi:hypothetical protein